MSKGLDSFLSKLDTLSKNEIVKVYVPSLKKEIPFKLFSVGQQKELIRTALTGVDGAVKCGIIYDEIIQSNCQEDVELSLEDKNAILIALRRETIGNTIKIEDTEYDLSDLPTKLDPFKPRKETLKFSGLEVKLEIPTIEQDKAVSEKALIDISKLKEDKKKVESVNIILTYEIIKFIKSIKDGDAELSFDDLNMYERKKVVESLPLKINNKIITFIGTVTEYANQYITFKDDTVVEFDAGFLTRE